MCDGCKPLPREDPDFRGPRDPFCKRYEVNTLKSMLLGILFAGVFCLVVGAGDWLLGVTGPLEGLFTAGLALLIFGILGFWYRDNQEKEQKGKEAKAEIEAVTGSHV
jgi:hypothetical protein